MGGAITEGRGVRGVAMLGGGVAMGVAMGRVAMGGGAVAMGATGSVGAPIRLIRRHLGGRSG